MTAKGTTKLTLDIDEVCDLIVEGKTMGEIAKLGGISLPGLLKWIEADGDRSARVRDTRTKRAKLWDEKATEVIEQAQTSFELAKAKELAHHYRWRASKVAPKEYGDKVEIDGTIRSARQMSDEELLAIAARAKP